MQFIHHYFLVLPATLLMLAGSMATAPAHESGFGHSSRTLFFSRTADGISLEYRIHLPPEEAMAEMAWMDGDRDGRISEQEKQEWFLQKGRKILAHLAAKTEHAEPLEMEFSSFQLGAGLTQTFRYILHSQAGVAVFEDANFAHRPGIVRTMHGKDLQLALLEEVPSHHAGLIRLKMTRIAEPKEENHGHPDH